MDNLRRPIGLHVRLHKGLNDVVQAVEKLHMNVVQSFLITESNDYIPMSDKLFDGFIKAKKEYGFLYFVHAAYWSGLTDVKSKMFMSLKKEVSIASDLRSDGIVIHVGAGKKGRSKQDQAKYVAESVNALVEARPGVRLFLENSPHAGKSFGGDIQDFAYVLDHIEKKEQVAFCIDTAHAFVFGYDLVKEKSCDDFLTLVDDLLGSHVQLLHFNDSVDRCGSYIDKHEEPGAGMIGQTAMQRMMKHSIFKDIPLIIELPGSCSKEEQEVLRIIAAWDKD